MRKLSLSLVLVFALSGLAMAAPDNALILDSGNGLVVSTQPLADMAGQLDCWDAPISENSAVVIGNEGSGAGPELKAAATLLRIPMAGGNESLNAAAAGAMIMYEALRQKGRKE